MEQDSVKNRLNLAISFAVIDKLWEDHIEQTLWEGIAYKNVEKMAPQCAHLQYNHIVQSFVLHGSQNPIKIIPMELDYDPQAAPIDTLSFGSIDAQPKPKERVSDASNRKMSDAKSRKMSDAYLTGRLSTNRSFHRKQQKQTLQAERTKQRTNSTTFVTRIPGIQLLVTDLEQQKLRSRRIYDEQQTKNRHQFTKKRQQQIDTRAKRSEKILKELKKYTYNYEGQLSNVGNASGLDKPNYSKLRSTYTQNKLLSKELAKPLMEDIQNDKQIAKKTRASMPPRDKFVPEFNENGPKSIIEVFDEKGVISEGVKLIQSVNNQNLTKESPFKSRNSKYHLNEYRQITEGNTFREHKYLKRNSQTIIPQDKSDTHIAENPKSTKGLKSEKSMQVVEKAGKDRRLDGYGALPPLRGGLRSKSLARASQKSFDLSSISKKIDISRIMVEDSDLFEQNFAQFGSKNSIIPTL